MSDIEIVQVKVYVPAEVRRMAKMEAARSARRKTVLTDNNFISSQYRTDRRAPFPGQLHLSVVLFS